MNFLEVFTDTTQQKIFNFLAQNLGEEFFESELVEKTNLSQGGVHQALKELSQKKLISVKGEKRRRRYFADPKNPLVRQWKSFVNIMKLLPLVEKLKPKAQKIILFGSQAEGIDQENSDTDLFVVSRQPKKIQKIVNMFSPKVQLVVRSPEDMLLLEKKNPPFYQEVSRGIILYEVES